MRHISNTAFMVVICTGLSACGGGFSAKIPNPMDLFKGKSSQTETTSEDALVDGELPDGEVAGEVAGEVGEPLDAVEIGEAGQSAEELDTTSQTERAEATSATAAGEALGTTTAALGDTSQPGFWLQTPLVREEQPGVVQTASGKSVKVILIPLPAQAGSGSAISIAAMRALGLELTSLPVLSVFKS